jgi:hypothetical protein
MKARTYIDCFTCLDATHEKCTYQRLFQMEWTSARDFSWTIGERGAS